MESVEVYKFGGASVKDAAAIRNVADRLRDVKDQPLVVVISAMGKTTNALEVLIDAHYNHPADLPALFNNLQAFHNDIVESLMPEQSKELLIDLHDLWVELNWILEEDPHPDYNYHYDQIIVFGELASTKIVSAYLKAQGIVHEWMDARSFMITDSDYREARILWEQTSEAVNKMVKPVLAQNKIVITQGFIGSTVYLESSTLGREGSDYTAAVLAHCLDATSVTFWKDVPGIMTGDPRQFEEVTLLKEITYREALEMTYYGAKVIHQKTIKPLQNKNIPLYVRSFDQPTHPGTKISTSTTAQLPPIVVVENNQVLIQIATRDFSFVAEGQLSEIFALVSSLRIKVNSMRNTAMSFLLCVRNETDKLEKLRIGLAERYDVKMEAGLQLITIRHADQAMLDKMHKGKTIIFEERFGDTDQFIVKSEGL